MNEEFKVGDVVEIIDGSRPNLLGLKLTIDHVGEWFVGGEFKCEEEYKKAVEKHFKWITSSPWFFKFEDIKKI